MATPNENLVNHVTKGKHEISSHKKILKIYSLTQVMVDGVNMRMVNVLHHIVEMANKEKIDPELLIKATKSIQMEAKPHK